jgi:hypothetical protein
MKIALPVQMTDNREHAVLADPYVPSRNTAGTTARLKVVRAPNPAEYHRRGKAVKRWTCGRGRAGHGRAVTAGGARPRGARPRSG